MNPSMRSALRRLGWGLLFPLVDLHLGIFDIFPDIIGYVMILFSLGRLGAVDGGFKAASLLAGILILLSLPQLVTKTSIDINQLAAAPLGLHVYMQAASILHALLVYFIFRGLHAIAEPIAPRELRDALTFRLKFYMTLFCAQLFLYPFLLNMEDSWAIMLLFIGFFMLVAELLLIRLPFRLSRLRNAPIEHDDNPGAAPL
ncbi:hypothetical protein KP806_19060 [Paenibacillus sp. N4]|uniref:hypothetical protein n=1 Tax=Paenibacillus vietnamensis TaxID=2590547 RepID=UPI001CD0B592|nr:hypothetical protein [Paenibacillus vietnamensis]MCA0757167.1 hypothetical protein [Paenibacillus vietnamensis]